MQTTMSDPTLDCVGCGALVPCGNIDDNALYAMEDQPLPYVINCPNGFTCSFGDGQTVYLQCCNQVLSVTFPNGATSGQIQQLLNNIISQCLRLNSMCGGPPIGPPPGGGNPNPQIQLYFNRP